jgi:surfactin synthase thioesterase subunit
MRADDAATSRWVMRFRPATDSPTRLVCFPHAGGSATFFHPLAIRFSPAADVIAMQYPGRQDRRREPCIEDIGVLADRLTDELSALSPKPTVFFGHSMGATLAFETAWRLEQAGTHAPRALLVSGRRSPLSYRRERVHTRDDEGIVAELKRLGGTDMELVDDEILRLTMPAIRSDYRAIETYVGVPGRRLRCGIVALTGDADPLTTVDEANRWREHTEGSFRLAVFPGGHFFLTTNREAVQNQISRELAGIRQLFAIGEVGTSR